MARPCNQRRNRRPRESTDGVCLAGSKTIPAVINLVLAVEVNPRTRPPSTNTRGWLKQVGMCGKILSGVMAFVGLYLSLMSYGLVPDFEGTFGRPSSSATVELAVTIDSRGVVSTASLGAECSSRACAATLHVGRVMVGRCGIRWPQTADRTLRPVLYCGRAPSLRHRR